MHPNFMNWVEFLQLVDEDLMENQTKQIVQLFKSHCIMLEHQAQVSHQLVELGQTLSPKMFLLILQSSVQPMYQLTIPQRSLCQSSHHQRKNLAEMRKSSEIFCQIQDNSHSGQKTVLLYIWLQPSSTISDGPSPSRAT